MSKEDQYYIGNEDFKQNLRDYLKIYHQWKRDKIEEYKKADKNIGEYEIDERLSKENKPITGELWIKFDTLAQNLLKVSNFSNLPYAQDMVDKAVDRCLNNAHMFNPDATMKETGLLLEDVSTTSDKIFINVRDARLKIRSSGLLFIDSEEIRYNRKLGKRFMELERSNPQNHLAGTEVHFPTSPFSYFTSVVIHIFYQHIKQENREEAKKERCQENFEIYSKNYNDIDPLAITNFEYANIFNTKNKSYLDEDEEDLFDEEIENMFY